MTNAGDVRKQVETALYDSQYPPTLAQKEILTSILYQINSETREYGKIR